MNARSIKKKVGRYAMNLELALAIGITVGILIGLISVVKYLVLIFQTDIHDIYLVLNEFLRVTLLLVVGVELVLMLLTHSSSSIIELVLFAIARKMLVYSENMLDLILGTIAIAIVFAIRKYLMSKVKFFTPQGSIVSAALPIHDINFDADLDLPENKGHTLGGLICTLAEESGIPVVEGAEYDIDDVNIKIISMKDGLIENVIIKEKTMHDYEDNSETKALCNEEY